MKALTPLRYCEFRLSGNEEGICATMAGVLVHGMAFCEGHGTLVEKGIEDSGVELVPTGLVKSVKGGA